MKILQIIPSISLVYGGPSQMILGFAAALARQGIDVTILTTNSNGDQGQPPLDVPLDQPVFQDGYQVRYFRCSPFRRYKFSAELLQWLYQHTKEFDIAHIHALFSPVSTASAMICRNRKLPYILRPLGTLDPADLEKKKVLKKAYIALFEKPNLAGAAAIHFTSHQEAKVSAHFGLSTQDLIIPLGVNAPAPVSPKQTLETSSPCILFMSRIEPKKGLNILIPALEKLLSENINFHFILAGNNPQDAEYETKIRLQIEESTLANHTTITGFVSGEIKAKFLQESDIFVLPSYYENFGIAVAEAMVSGLPVVISNQVYIWQDVEKAKAGWVANCDVESLAGVLRLALQDPAERKQRGLNAQQYALKHYNWDNIAQKTIQIYQQILLSKNL
ncbi:hormogonium polysaccharide biosynthesis glycosyltransferase HpsP [Ancylothrix sp. C2]|uniref:hormogonium polysaccharide biosynthesis glycosyltransferase HpsP n=1 Tax=Ancylothrix sp. D3o TaxID=2953691 RepID=UPI0021BB51D9|nr:hormogonium polysaccharide biosynthesis glycosyltransferase HpsP [Ancylothrix sp. D3o]MCT7951316.1 hormogonium polysaccharide biosynthesis glycosyltransferase HpsP [Ancylothrix sp. D3o]